MLPKLPQLVAVGVGLVRLGPKSTFKTLAVTPDGVIPPHNNCIPTAFILHNLNTFSSCSRRYDASKVSEVNTGGSIQQRVPEIQTNEIARTIVDKETIVVPIIENIVHENRL